MTYTENLFLRDKQIFEVQKVLHRLMIPLRNNVEVSEYVLPDLLHSLHNFTKCVILYEESTTSQSRIALLQNMHVDLRILLGLVYYVPSSNTPYYRQILSDFMDRLLEEICKQFHFIQKSTGSKLN